MTSPNKSPGILTTLAGGRLAPVLLALAVGSSLGYFQGCRNRASDTLTGAKTEKVKDRDKGGELKVCLGLIQNTQGEIRSLQINREATKRERDSVLALVGSSDQQILDECHEIERERRRLEGKLIAEMHGLTHDEHVEQIMDAFELNCHLSPIQVNRDSIEIVNRAQCPYIVLKGERVVSVEQYDNGTESEQVVLDHFRNERYEEGVLSFSDVMSEISPLLSELTEMGFVHGETVQTEIERAYDSIRSDMGHEGYCEYYSHVNPIFEIIEEADWEGVPQDQELKAFDNWEKVENKLKILQNLMNALMKRDYPDENRVNRIKSCES